MKLDPRIIEGKKPLTPFDTEMAKQFIGKRCYFASKFENFKNLSDVPQATLQNVDGSSTPFQCYGAADIPCYDCFILPLEWVKKEKPKKYRPYKNYDELYRDFAVGQIITYRDKDCNCIYYAEITEAFVHTDGDVFVGIGNTVRALSGWFQTIEVKDPETDEWVPFGVLE